MTAFLAFLNGKKTYISAVAGLLAALVALLDQTITAAQFVAAAWVIAQTVFIRAGINSAALTAITNIVKDTAKALPNDTTSPTK